MNAKDEGLTYISPPLKKSQTATVIHCEPGKIVLNVERSSSCSGCNQRSTCAHRSTEHLLNKPITITLNEEKVYDVGQSVELELDPKIILKSAFLLYCVPIMFLLLGALIADFFTHNQSIILGVSIITFLVSLFIIRHKTSAYEQYVINEIKIDSK
ncbi:SoxR reducing system RseC family protein [Thorsellia anophelis]|uniref:Positive regulator of sigma(E), RseC/MucC n=1 Tax=Thorsellia anophelis DSM 18579 TaxID=1123402 RepID=A0A1I0EKE2_9GAMM|nr:SoxR reducing system RseC family protein [Thorsellia anophelis]SET45766.1 positive regulator of sigma(E), RseC/MucC [Thorsellia anophelis DSM 18579]